MSAQADSFRQCLLRRLDQRRSVGKENRGQLAVVQFVASQKFEGVATVEVK